MLQEHPRKENVKKFERVGRIATKLVPELSNMAYEDKLKKIKLLTLEQKRVRGDLITLNW